MANLNLPVNSWVLIDTNFLIDFYSKQQVYSPLLQQLKEQENILVSLDCVRCEFLRSKTKDVVKQKSTFFELIIESLLPLDKEIMKLVQPTIENYGSDIEKVSLTDIYLACTIQRYRQLYLLTRNHQDFPIRLFSRTHLFNIELDKEVKTYGLYQHKHPDEKKITTETSDIPF